MTIKSVLLALVTFAFGLFLLTFKLTTIPPGIDTDEGAIAYNAALISKSLYDENGRFLPFFILSADRIDWKQPVLIYSSAIFFKLFGVSFLGFKLVNIIFSVAAAVLLFILLNQLFSYTVASLGVLVYFVTPGIIITSRIGNESINPVFFSSLWLLSLFFFQKNKAVNHLIIASISLGIGFYSFKGMRIIVPIWIIISILFICWQYIKDGKEFNSLQKVKVEKLRVFFSYLYRLIKKLITNKRLIFYVALFIVVLLPFFLIIPFLERKYPGAVFDRKGINIDPLRHYFFYWLSNLSLSSLFFKGDIGKIYETPLYGFLNQGMLLPFLVGALVALKRKGFFLFTLLCYLLSPILIGLAGSLDYPHRLIASIPFYVIITTLGLEQIISYFLNSKYAFYKIQIAIIVTLLLTLNIYSFLDFSHYYYFIYSKLHSTNTAFHNHFSTSFYQLSKISKSKNLDAYIQENLYLDEPEGNKFFEMAYFNKPLKVWKQGDSLSDKGVLLTQLAEFGEYKNSDIDIKPLNILINK